VPGACTALETCSPPCYSGAQGEVKKGAASRARSTWTSDDTGPWTRRGYKWLHVGLTSKTFDGIRNAPEDGSVLVVELEPVEAEVV
jgi:hypothetical protein